MLLDDPALVRKVRGDLLAHMRFGSDMGSDLEPLLAPPLDME